MRSSALVWVLVALLIAGCGGGSGGGGGTGTGTNGSGAIGGGSGSGTNGGGGGGSSAPAGLVPVAPTGLSTMPSNGQVSLSWSASATAVTYNVYAGTSAGGESATPMTTGITGLTYVISSLTNGNTYYFKVAAVNANGTSSLSAEASTTPATTPAAPSNVTATASSGQVVLNWTASSSATTYNVYEGTTPGGETASPVAAGLSNPNTTITGLKNGGIYFFTVTATNIDVLSPVSSEISVVPVAPVVANGQLLPEVLVLTDAQNNQIASETASLVTFTGAATISQGTVFLTNDGAYIADSSITSNGQTLVSVHAPQVNDIFSNLQISGTFPLTSDTAVSVAHQSARRSDTLRQKSSKAAAGISGTLTQTFPIDQSVGVFSASGNVTANLSANINYNFSGGTLQSASVTVNQTNQTAITATLSAGTSASAEFPIATFSIPIPVSIVDGILSAIGVRVASIYVPVSAVLSGDVSFDETAILTASSQATASATYSSGSTPTVTGTISGSTSLSVDPSTVSTTGSGVVATLQANAGLYLHLRPALSFLNNVALLGADVQAGPTGHFAAQIIAETPPFCLQITKSLDGKVSGFFKTVGVSVTTSSLDVSENLPPAVYIGSCTIPTNVTASIDASSLPATYYSPIVVDVSVAPQSSAQAQGKVPSGTVTVSMSGNSCTATLGDTGIGNCTLPASPAGQSAPYQLSYSGDTNFSPSNSGASVNVGRAKTITGVTISQTNTTGSPVTFSASVAADPPIDAEGAEDPSETVEIDDPGQNTLCVMTLDTDGSGTCSATFASAVNETVTAEYNGDTNYMASSGTATLTVKDSPLSVTLIATQSSVSFGTPVTLIWTSANTGSCTESGGAPGDLWGGATVLLSGQQPISESAAGTYTYTITCASPDGTIQKTASSTVVVQPTLTLSASLPTVSTGTAFGLTWGSAGANSCTESGGSSGDGWSGTASSLNSTQMVMETAAGTFTYTMTCMSQDSSAQVSQSAIVKVTAAPNPWVGTWVGTLVSTCGTISGPATTVITAAGPGTFNETTIVAEGSFGPYTFSYNGNIATSPVNNTTYTLSPDGKSFSGTSPGSCQSGVFTLQD
jgi:fibronectin type 3 domain-containing protein